MSRMDSRASGKHRGLDARPPPGRNRALSGAFDGGRGARIVLDSGFRRNDEHQGAMNRASTKNLPLSGCSPPMVPPLRRGDVDSRLRGNDGSRKGLRRG